MMTGGLGNDTYIVDATGDTVIENLNEGIDTVQSSVSYTLGSNLENLSLAGTSAINGTGNSLNNLITGNAAANTLTGGLGKDTLTGGGGADKFTYTAASETGASAATRDIITDFSTAQGDKIDVKAIDANTVLAGKQSWSFVTNFTGAAGQVKFDAASHLVLFDQNGDKAAEFAIELAGVSSLTAADFVFA
jgi:Ca2+-binding RTX toxin-like protein